MKKIWKTSLILFSVICMTVSVYAASCSMGLKTTKNEFSKNDEVVVDVVVDSISDAGEGIIGLKATLEYDKNSLTYEKMEGQNGWETPSYNEENGTFVMLRNDLVNTPETILKMKFKVKDQDTKNATVTLKDITVSGGIDTGDISVSNINKTITIKDATVTPKPDTNTSTNNTNTNTNNTTINTNSIVSTNATKNTSASENKMGNKVVDINNSATTNTMKSGILPKTGSTNIMLVVVAGLIVLAITFFIKIKTLGKNIK